MRQTAGTPPTMRRRALHQAEPMPVRRALSSVGLWLSVAALVLSGLVSLLVVLAALWGVWTAGLWVLQFALRLLGLGAA